MPALSAGGPGEHSEGWRLESEPYVPQPQPSSSTLWALVEPGLPGCVFRLSLKHSSDVHRRRQLKLQAFPTINESKEQMHNFGVLF